MKKFLRFFAIALCVAIASIALVACGNNDGLTEEDIAGTYETTSVTVTLDNETNTYSKTEYTTLQNKENKTRQDSITLEILNNFFGEYNVNKDDHKVYSGENEIAEWKVEDGKLVYTAPEDSDLAESNAEWQNGKIIVTGKIVELDNAPVSMTLEKVNEQ